MLVVKGTGTGSRRQVLRALVRVFGPRRISHRLALFASGLLWTIAFAVRALYAVDLAPVMYSHDQPGTRMAAHYEEAARAHLAGDGLLYPRTWPDPSDTGLLSRPPGYSLFMAAIYRLGGESYFDVQLAQSSLSALLPVLLFLFATRLCGRNAGLVAGALAAADAPLAYHSLVITPDALSALLAVAVMVFLWHSRWRARTALIAAGVLLGATTWLRPNFLLLAPFLAIGWMWATPRRKATLPWAVALVAAAVALVAPITVRNLRLYGEFVPVSINGGIVLWEGVAEATGDRFGAHEIDWQVAGEEAERHHDRRYAQWWASPDGIARDHERVQRSLAAIRAEPALFFFFTLGHAARILNYGNGGAPDVVSDPAPLMVEGPQRDAPAGPLLRLGRRISALRPVVAFAQWLLTLATPGLTLCGFVALAILCPRRLLVLALVPLYHLLTQAPLHYIPRFVLPMHPFMLVLAAAGALAVLAGARAVAGRAGRNT